MKILFLFPYPLECAPSQRFRFEQYLKLLTENKIDYTHQSFWDLKTWRVLYKPGHFIVKALGLMQGMLKRLLVLFRLGKYNYVFIHRECVPIGPPIFEWIIAKLFAKKIIYDFDDSIWLANTSTENKIAGFIKWHSKVASICKWSYKVSCGNDYLAAYARQYNTSVVVNPTTVDTSNLHNSSLYKNSTLQNKTLIGWTGTHSTLKYLDQIIPVLQRLENQYENHVSFLIIANQQPLLSLKNVLYIPWNKESEIQDLMMMDIGIMPLTDDAWAQGKCGFKALQYMALGIPPVASPVGVNEKIIEHGINGFICTDEEEWFNSLCYLIENAEARRAVGINAREKVMDNYSVSSNSATFLSLFK